MSLDRTVDVPEGGVHVVGDAAPVLHAARVDGLDPVLAGAEPPVAAGLEEVGVVVGVVAPAQRRLDPRHRQTQTPDGLRSSDLHLSIEHPVVLTCPEREMVDNGRQSSVVGKFHFKIHSAMFSVRKSSLFHRKLSPRKMGGRGLFFFSLFGKTIVK